MMDVYNTVNTTIVSDMARIVTAMLIMLVGVFILFVPVKRELVVDCVL